MKRKVTNNSYNFNGKVVNVGIDVHKLSWRVTALVEGVIVESATIKPSYRVLKKLLAQYKGARIRVAYEAGFSGFNLYDELIDSVIPPCAEEPLSFIRETNCQLIDRLGWRKIHPF